MVCSPEDEGGLGVLNITAQNESLLLKNLHKFFNKAAIPWFGISIILWIDCQFKVLISEDPFGGKIS